MMPARAPEDVVRIDVSGTLAAVTLVERLRWARPSVQPLEGSDWRITVDGEADSERVLRVVRTWLRDQELPAITVLVAGMPRRVEAAPD